MELLEQVKLKISANIQVSDDLINLYIEDAIKSACLYTGYTTLPSDFEHLIVDIVVESINRRGNEGVSNNSGLGISTTYLFKDIEDSVRSKFKGKKNPSLLVGRTDG